MSPPGFGVAAALVAALALAHSVLGERFILRPLFRLGLPPLFGDDSFTKQTLRFAWHALTLAWWGLAVLLVLVPVEAQRLVGAVAIGMLAVTSVMTLLISRGRHLSWLVEWVAIAAVATGL